MARESVESVTVAYVKKAHALDGELFVQLQTDYPEHVFARDRVFRVSGGGPVGLTGDLTLLEARPHAGGWILEFEEIGDRTLAERYQGRTLSLRADELVERGEDEYFLHELPGIEVQKEDGATLGEVVEVYPTAGRPLLAVRTAEGDEELVPFVRNIVQDVDLEEKVMRIRPPAGLLEL